MDGRTDARRMHDGHNAMTIARWPSASGAKRNSVNSFISICLSDLKDQKLPVSAIKTQINDNRPKILLARLAHKWSRQLACSKYGLNQQSGRLLTSKPDSCEIISKSDQRFLRPRFFKNFFMSV